MRLRMELMPPVMDWLGCIFLLAGVFGSSLALWQRQELVSAIAQHKEVIAQEENLSRQSNSADMQTRSPEAARALVQIAQDLNRPWEPMLDALREASGSSVRINRIQPGEDGLTLQIAGQANDAKSFLAYIGRLRAGRVWRTIEPLSQEPMEAGEVSFQLALEWQP